MAFEERENIVIAAAWMVGITMLLFFLPLVNGLIGGAVGGYKAGTPSRGFMAALIPALVVGAALWLVFGLFGGPVIGFFAGAAAGMLVLLADVGMFVGALVGGYFAETRGPRRIRPA
jgi:hypothetical protein